MSSHMQRRPRGGVPVAKVLATLLIVVSLGILFAFFVWPGVLVRRDSSQQAAQQSEASSEKTAERDGATDATGEATGTSEKTSGATDKTATYGGKNDPRNEEFAVDPERTTWNTEPSGEKTVWLTFDDGPSANTQAVLDILDKYGIKATFFVTGINPEYLPMVKKCYERGHTIGLHTYSHDYAQVYASTDAYWNDLDRIGEAVREQIGYVPCFIRFPGGSSNTISADYTKGIMSTLADEVVAAGYQYYDWDASCGDGAPHTADELVAATEADTTGGLTNVIFLAHDGAGKEATVEALPHIIEHFKSQGYKFAALDRDACVTHHGIGN